MNIPQDKLKHFAAGFVIALAVAVAWFIVSRLGAVDMRPAWLAVLIASTVAGAVKEKADADDNKVIPGMHGVEWQDAAATAFGAIPVAISLWSFTCAHC